MRAIMYHYVRPEGGAFPGLRYLHLDAFRRQLDHLAGTDGFVAQDAFLAAVRGEGPVPDGCVLTFDDGLADHVDHVLPELLERGLWGTFYVPAGPHLDGRVLDVHRVHALLARHDPQRVATTLDEVLGDGDIDPHEEDRLRDLVYRARDDHEAALHVRTLLNYLVRTERRTAVLDRVEAIVGPSTTPEEWYATSDGLRRLDDAGMVLGSHSCSHRSMAQLDAAEQRHEIEDSFGWLESIVGPGGPRTFCYPYGGAHTFSSVTERLLDEADVAWSFSVEPRPIGIDDLRHRRQALPRFDCCELPHGRAHERAG
jgi:peptidoglycan/xylan/chitin deacetylase (PgdA/CDA1 family)